MQTPCPCGSGRPYDGCCSAYLSGRATPPTAEALMRSRYTAYAREHVDYLYETSSADVKRGFSHADAAAWARAATFTGLDVLATEAGGEGDDEGVVDFAATWEEGGKARVLRERSRFVREEGLWRYAGGTRGETVRRDAPKVGRNDPCPCGSGKKFKKCCGA
ncbi:MAG: SEC-C domain-containing protein [Myxococcales bacterium]|nr:SEC-C domain-containing protein [Myxococcales bacterium]